ncbi:MAG: ABC transporter ATP-binding protein, partial [Pseudomonadota bacterium]
LAQDLPGIWEARGTTTFLVTHSVAEAALLSDRIIVFSPRPARVVADVAVDLPRPRPREIAYDPAFRAATDQVFDALARGVAQDVPNAAQ